jgi:uncharacterized protein (DUF302 family)
MKAMYPIFLLLLVSLFSCNDDDENSTIVQNPTAFGLSYAQSDQDFSTTFTSLQTALEENENIGIVSVVDHQANAQNVGLELLPTREIIFGNPAIGTLIMQANQLAGLELPQKMLVYQDADNNVFVGYNSANYLVARHAGVSGVETIEQLSTALSNLAQGATNGSVSENSSSPVTDKKGIITVTSTNNFETTYTNLRNAVSENNNLILVAEVDHQANAASVGMSLRPTRLIIFGNPNLGTPLMQNSQTTGIDLPQKILVWEAEDGTVNISYNAPSYLVLRHAITENAETISTITNALEMLASTAAN